jgi:hypothetical protein
MLRLSIVLALSFASHGVLAAPAAGGGGPAGAGSSAAPTAKPASPVEPEKLMPPLPPLATLPPSAAQATQAAEESDDEAAPARGAHRTKKPSRGHARTGRPAEPTIRMVVSEQSRSYLTSVSRQLDTVLQGGTQGAHAAPDAAAVAMAR